MYSILNDDCLNAMSAYADKHFHACVTDPPYGLNFMGKNWDHGVPNKIYWQEVYRVLRPGGYLLAFGGTRMFHRLMVEIEDAGFEIRDTIMWVYGSGFPKGNNISKAIDKMLGNEPEIVCKHPRPAGNKPNGNSLNMSLFGMPQENVNITKPTSDIAKQWDGWNTNLKPAWEPIIVARKPVEGTVAQNVIKYGTGGINIDGCRVEAEDLEELQQNWNRIQSKSAEIGVNSTTGGFKQIDLSNFKPDGRYPANLIHDGSDEVLKHFPDAGGGYGKRGSFKNTNLADQGHEYKLKETGQTVGYGDSGSAARFFYCAKTSIKDRNEGCEMFEPQVGPKQMQDGSQGKIRSDGTVIKDSIKHHNHHPTVKPTSLMRYLCKLVTPKDGIILDPFCGSGSTGKAAILEGFNFVGIEKEADYAAIASKRCEHAQNSHLNK